MKLFVLTALLYSTTNAFVPTSSKFGTSKRFVNLASTSSSAATPDTIETPEKNAAKIEVIDLSERLKEEYGIFLLDKTAKTELQDAVSELEKLSELPAFHNYEKELLGDWELVVTTATSNDGIDTSKLPFLDVGPLKQIRDSIRKSLNKYLKVQQLIRSGNDDGKIDRIDHVLQYQPPKELRDVLDNLPSQISELNINPLAVSKSKLILIHKAKVESELPLKIDLSLKSVVLNVAGSSQFLDPNGKDVTGINVPLGEFLNAGSFETTYMDDELRISRGKLAGGLVDQLRIFVRPGKVERDAALRDIQNSEYSVGEGVDAELDVDDVIDPEFVDDISPSDVEDSN